MKIQQESLVTNYGALESVENTKSQETPKTQQTSPSESNSTVLNQNQRNQPALMIKSVQIPATQKAPFGIQVKVMIWETICPTT